MSDKPDYEIRNGAGRQLLALYRRGPFAMLSLGVPGSKNQALITITGQQAHDLAAALAPPDPEETT